MKTRFLCLFALVATLTLQPFAADAAQPLELKNAGFAEWQEGVPQGWTVGVGARSGGAGVSRLVPVEGGGIELGGEAATGQWRVVSQRVPVSQGGGLRLKFEAQTAELRREAGQNDDCYVGLNVLDAGGQRVAFVFRSLFETKWAPGQLVTKLPDAAAAVEVTLFLSKSGTLQVRNLKLEKLVGSDSFDVIEDELDRYYSFFALKKLDWRARAAAYEAKARDAKTPEQFAAAILPLLAELKDLHVVVQMADGRQIPAFAPETPRNFDARTIAGALKDVKQIGRMGFTARTPEGYGYVAIGTLAADAKTTADMLAAFDALLDAKGLIVDLRVNGGGQETVAQQFASRLIAEPLPYAKNQFRGGAAHGDLLTLGTRQVQPHSDKPFRGPVACLIGPGCVSSGEGMALMFKALPQARLIGQPTRGASGNPQPVALPNGLIVSYSTWVPLDLDDRPFEGVGIPPTKRIDNDPTGLKGLQAAVADLAERLR